MADLFEQLKSALADRYRLEKELGRGGMATVYLAQDAKHHRQVAVKVLKPELGAALGPERFLREIEIAAQLNHPHILTLIDSGEAAGLLYYVMPYVEGESLRARLAREGELPVDMAMRILRDVVDALSHAHRHGVVHRDIKPDNVLLLDQHAVVTDFGVAKALSAAGGYELTTAGIALGTPAYMAPEQVAADPHVDHRADIYAVGVTGYEMLTGRPPFSDLTPHQVLAAHITTEPDPLLQYRPSVPAAVAEVVMRCLHKSPADRWQSADELLHQLEAVTTPTGGVAQLSAAAGPRTVPRHRGRALAGGAVALAVLALAGLFALRGGGAASSERSMLAVLPFQNLGEAEDEYFADGITEEITSRLAILQGLGVISRTSAMQYKGTDKSLPQIGDELGVQYLLEGTVRWQRNPGGPSRVRVTPQLIRVSDDTHLWAAPYDAVLADIFKVQSEIAGHVAEALGVTLLEGQRRELERIPTDNLEAYDYYLRGKDYLRRGWGAENVKFAQELFGRAVTLDSAFALAHAALAETHLRSFFLYYDRTASRLASGREAVDRSMRLAPQLPEAHLALAQYHYWGELDYPRALGELAIARQVKPNDAEILRFVGYVLRRQGNWEAAADTLERVLRLDPRRESEWISQSWNYLVLRRYDEMARCIDRAQTLAPDWQDPYLHRAWLFASQGDAARARGVLTEARARLGESFVASVAAFDASWYAMWRFLDDGMSGELEDLPATSRPLLDATTQHLARAELLGFRGQAARARVQYDSARAGWERLIQSRPQEAFYRVQLGIAHAGLGNRAEAVRAGRAAGRLMPITRDAFDGTVVRMWLAQLYVMVGDHDAALGELEQLLAIPSFLSPGRLTADPVWEPLRDQPRFRQLLRGS